MVKILSRNAPDVGWEVEGDVDPKEKKDWDNLTSLYVDFDFQQSERTVKIILSRNTPDVGLEVGGDVDAKEKNIEIT